MTDDQLTDAEAWRELTAPRADDHLMSVLAEAARRHRVMVSISVSPYDEQDADDE